MEQRALGRTGLSVSAVGFGCGAVGGLMVKGEPAALTPKEFDLLATFLRFANITLDREKLLDLVWGTAFYSMRTVDVHIVRLRSKLEGSGLKIETVWGSGYRLVEAVPA